MFSHQVSRTLAGDAAMSANLGRTEEIAREVCAALEAGDLSSCGELMNAQWETKRARAPGMVTERTDELRDQALEAGAAGVTLMGAGGGGFLLVYAPEPERVRAALGPAVPELRFGSDLTGCTATLS
jgi:D-glycero-alpha-D-manno-heptose-7-phosphate kinase